MNLNEMAAQCDDALASRDDVVLKHLVQQLKKHLKSGISDDQRVMSHYLLGNLYSGLSSVTKESSASWRDNEYPVNLTAAINHLRQAEALGIQNEASNISEIRTNLANEMAHQRRNIEVLEYWVTDFSLYGDAPFVSALSKAKELLWISHWLNDPSHTQLYQYEAYLLLKKLQKNITKTTHSATISSINNDKEIISLLKFGNENFAPLAGWQLKFKNHSYHNDEKRYRSWCLQNTLFVNFINDLTKEWIADQDILQFPNHVVSVGDGPYFSAAFSSLKREFCFARFMAFEGIHQVHPDYENQKLFLTDTLDYVHYSGSIEKIKTAFRVCFSVFDSISSLMAVYFQCNKNHVGFSSIWIKENFKNINENYFVDALYWLSCDLTDNPDLTNNSNKWKAPNPSAAEIRKIRNAIEHGWLRVAGQEKTIWETQNDFAYVITPDNLQQSTLFLLKLVRSAMLYIYMAVSYNENQSKNTDGFVPSFPVILVDDDFI